jgi:hypothetical protein
MYTDTNYKTKKALREAVDTRTRLAGFTRNGPNYLHHDDFENVVDVMRTIVDTRHGVSAPLASGVGNNMSYSFYVRDSFDSVRFYPDGINGGMITLRNIEAR